MQDYPGKEELPQVFTFTANIDYGNVNNKLRQNEGKGKQPVLNGFWQVDELFKWDVQAKPVENNLIKQNVNVHNKLMLLYFSTFWPPC